MGPLANSLKLTTRMVSGFPKSDFKGVEWLLDIVATLVPQAIDQLTDDQLEIAALKFIDLGLLIMDNLPPKGGDSIAENQSGEIDGES